MRELLSILRRCRSTFPLAAFPFLDGDKQQFSTYTRCGINLPSINPSDWLVRRVSFSLLRYGSVFVAGRKDNPYRILLYGGTGAYPNAVRRLFVTHVLGVQVTRGWPINR